MGHQARSHRVILLMCLLWAAPAFGQARPGNFTTINALDTSADALHVGCAVTSSTCTGGIKGGTIALVGATSTITNASATLNVTTGAGVTTTVQPGFIGTTTATTLSFLANNAVQATLTTGGVFTATGLLGGNGTNAAPSIAFTNSTDTGFYRTGSQAIGIATAGALRWGYDNAGNSTFGTSAHIADAQAAVTLVGGTCGTSPSIVGRVYGFEVTVGTGGVATGCTVNFNVTFNTQPACVVYSRGGNVLWSAMSTTQIAITTPGAATPLAASDVIAVLCRGY